MKNLFNQFARPVLANLDPEFAHRATVTALRFAPMLPGAPDDARLASEVFGLKFSNPVGMAAGFDKNAEAIDGTLALGFGFTEVGTITPRAQPGNPRPRIFRLPEDHAVINRYGFNSDGHGPARARLVARKSVSKRAGVLGVNLGANKDSTDRAADYVLGIEAFAGLADYFTINVSSPNTPGLRDLQEASALDELLARVLDARAAVHARTENAVSQTPVLLKIAPDLTLVQLDDIVGVALKRGIDGMIVSNTTISRPSGLHSPHKSETGGLSGKPLFDLSTQMLAATFQRVERRFPLIGAGGIDSAEAAWIKIEAGASLVQFYSALVFEGPGLANRIKQGLCERMTREAFESLASIVGRRAADLAS